MTEEATPAVPATPDQAPAPTPPWGSPEEFDPDKAWKLIQDLRADKEKLAARPVLDEPAKQRLAEYDRLVAASKTELERTTEELNRWQSDAERWRTAAVASKAEALAAADFEYPDLAVGKLDLGKYLGADGQIDDSAIKADLQQVLTDYPRLGRSSEPAGPRTPAPNPAQGSGGNGNTAGDPAQEFAAILGAQLH